MSAYTYTQPRASIHFAVISLRFGACISFSRTSKKRDNGNSCDAFLHRVRVTQGSRYAGEAAGELGLRRAR